MNGDSILNTFATVTSKNYWLGQFMIYSFVFMSICVWQNMNLVIVEDSYLNVKYKTGYSWLTGSDDDDQQPPNQATSPQGIFHAGLFTQSGEVGYGGPPPPGVVNAGNEYPKGTASYLNFPLDASQTFQMNVSSGMPAVYNPQDQPDKEGGRDDGSQKSDDSTAAQQHIEQPNFGYVAPTLINSEQLDEKVSGLSGYKKTNAILSEMKKNYKLNMLKNFIDQEAENVRTGGSKITPTAKTT